jgi:O-antigen ligase
MKIIFWFCLATLIFGLLARIPVGGSGVLALDILLPIFAILFLFQKIFIDRKIPKISFLPSALVFGAIAILSFLLGAWDLGFKEQALSASYLIRLFSAIIFAIATADFVQNDKKFRETFFRNIFIIAGIVVFLGFLQFLFLPDISTFSTEGGWDPHTGRLLGTWMDPNFVAGFLAFLIPVAIAHFYKAQKISLKIILLILIFSFLGALFLTFSRSGFLAAGIGFLLFFLCKDPKIIILGLLVISLGIIFNKRAQTRFVEFAGTVKSVIFQDTDEIDPTAKLRMENWQKSFELFQKYPITGIGYNTYRYRAAEEGVVDESYFSSGGSDSTHLTVLITTGIFGFLAFLWFCGQVFLVNLFRFFKEKNVIALGFASGFLALFFHAVFVNSFFFPLIFVPVMAVAGFLESKPRKV